MTLIINSVTFQVGRAGLALTEEQKIKLSIARAVLLNPSILLLDEVTGGLDFEAERAVQEALDLLMLGRSTIIIARRLSLIRNADYIAVMEEGQLVEMGTHDELLTLDGLYAELLKNEEAAKLPRRYNTKANMHLLTWSILGDYLAIIGLCMLYRCEEIYVCLFLYLFARKLNGTSFFLFPLFAKLHSKWVLSM